MKIPRLTILFCLLLMLIACLPRTPLFEPSGSLPTVYVGSSSSGGTVSSSGNGLNTSGRGKDMAYCVTLIKDLTFRNGCSVAITLSICQPSKGGTWPCRESGTGYYGSLDIQPGRNGYFGYSAKDYNLSYVFGACDSPYYPIRTSSSFVCS